MLLATHLSKRSQQISKQFPPTFSFFALRQIYSPTDILDYAITVIKFYCCEDLIKYRPRIQAYTSPELAQ